MQKNHKEQVMFKKSAKYGTALQKGLYSLTGTLTGG